MVHTTLGVQFALVILVVLVVLGEQGGWCLGVFHGSERTLSRASDRHTLDESGIDAKRNGRPRIETLSWSPRVFLYHDFLSDTEARHIISIAKPLMKRSTVVGLNGENEENNVRTSYGTFISRLHDPVITGIEERIAKWTHLNVSHQEDMQVLRYGVGQEYKPHYDSLVEESPRVATVVLYLNDVDQGGETAFPDSVASKITSVNPSLLSSCASGSVAVKPKRGDALLFFSLQPDLSTDMGALHTGCPVLEGVKWTATKWIHTAPFRPESLGGELVVPRFPDECMNYDNDCVSWAKEGECEANPKFMLGDSFSLGSCRLACGQCEECRKGDVACASRNRNKAGFLPLFEDDVL